MLRIYCKEKRNKEYVRNAFDKWISDCIVVNEYVSTPEKKYNATRAVQSDDNSDCIQGD